MSLNCRYDFYISIFVKFYDNYIINFTPSVEPPSTMNSSDTTGNETLETQNPVEDWTESSHYTDDIDQYEDSIEDSNQLTTKFGILFFDMPIFYSLKWLSKIIASND